jgi:hypothetical protein
MRVMIVTGACASSEAAQRDQARRPARILEALDQQRSLPDREHGRGILHLDPSLEA